MIAWTYTFTCDFCKGEIRPPMNYWNPPGVPAQVPPTVPQLGTQDICGKCLHFAQSSLRAKLAANGGSL